MRSSQKIFLKRDLKIFVKIRKASLPDSLFHKDADSRPGTLLKSYSSTSVFCEFCKNLNTFFYITPPGDCYLWCSVKFTWKCCLLSNTEFYEFSWPKFREDLLSWIGFVAVSGIIYRSSSSRGVRRKRFPEKYTDLKYLPCKM